MIRAIIYASFFTALAYCFYLIDLHSGNISFDALGYSIEARFWVFVLALLIFTIFLLITFVAVYKLISIPAVVKNFLTKRRFVKSNDLVKEYFKAASLNNDKAALKLINKIQSYDEFKEYYKATYLRHLAEIDKKSARLEALSMLNKSKQREPVLIFIITLNKAQKSFSENYIYATELFNISPSYFAAKARIEAMMELKDYEIALRFLEENRRYFDKAEMLEFSAAIDLEIANVCSKSRDLHGAIKHANTSLKAKYSHEAVVTLFDSYLKLSDAESAAKIVRNNWKELAKHSQSEIVMQLSKHASPEDFLKLARDLKKIAPTEFASLFILAKAELGADQFDKAYKTISETMEICKCRSAYLLMVEFCVRTHGSTAEIANWLNLAFHAKEISYMDAMWHD